MLDASLIPVILDNLTSVPYTRQRIERFRMLDMTAIEKIQLLGQLVKFMRDGRLRPDSEEWINYFDELLNGDADAPKEMTTFLIAHASKLIQYASSYRYRFRATCYEQRPATFERYELEWIRPFLRLVQKLLSSNCVADGQKNQLVLKVLFYTEGEYDPVVAMPLHPCRAASSFSQYLGYASSCLLVRTFIFTQFEQGRLSADHLIQEFALSDAGHYKEDADRVADYFLKIAEYRKSGRISVEEWIKLSKLLFVQLRRQSASLTNHNSWACIYQPILQVMNLEVDASPDTDFVRIWEEILPHLFLSSGKHDPTSEEKEEFFEKLHNIIVKFIIREGKADWKERIEKIFTEKFCIYVAEKNCNDNAFAFLTSMQALITQLTPSEEDTTTSESYASLKQKFLLIKMGVLRHLEKSSTFNSIQIIFILNFMKKFPFRGIELMKFFKLRDKMIESIKRVYVDVSVKTRFLKEALSPDTEFYRWLSLAKKDEEEYIFSDRTEALFIMRDYACELPRSLVKIIDSATDEEMLYTLRYKTMRDALCEYVINNGHRSDGRLFKKVLLDNESHLSFVFRIPFNLEDLSWGEVFPEDCPTGYKKRFFNNEDYLTQIKNGLLRTRNTTLLESIKTRSASNEFDQLKAALTLGSELNLLLSLDYNSSRVWFYNQSTSAMEEVRKLAAKQYPAILLDLLMPEDGSFVDGRQLYEFRYEVVRTAILKQAIKEAEEAQDYNVLGEANLKSIMCIPDRESKNKNVLVGILPGDEQSSFAKKLQQAKRANLEKPQEVELKIAGRKPPTVEAGFVKPRNPYEFLNVGPSAALPPASPANGVTRAEL